MTEESNIHGELTCRPRSDPDLMRKALEQGLSEQGAAAIANIDAVMQQIRRSFMRRDFGRLVLARLEVDLEVSHLDAMGAIAHAPVGESTDNAEITVGAVAERLELDPSRASRLVSDLVSKGYLRRVASQSDARRIGLELTESGRAFIAAVREIKWQAFSAALGSWPEADLIDFARLLEKYAGWTASAPGGKARSEAPR